MADPKFIALGRLRRDTMILGAGTKDEIQTLAEQATKEGRAAEVYVVAVAGYFTESTHNWSGLDTFTVGTAAGSLPGSAQTPALNPDSGAQPPTSAEKTDSPMEPETVAGNIAQAAADGPKGPDTGKADRHAEEAKGAGADTSKIDVAKEIENASAKSK